MRGKVQLWIVLVSVLAFLGVLVACGAEATPTPTPRPPTPTPIPPTATPTPLPPTATPTPAPAPVAPSPVSTIATPSPKPKAPIAGLPPVDTITDAEWAKIVEAAKKEGKVNVYEWESNWYRQGGPAQEFERTYGIKIEQLEITSSSNMERIASERRAGIYNADIVNIVGTYYPAMLKQDWFERIDNLPAVGDAYNLDVWFASPIWTPYYFRSPTIRRNIHSYVYNSKVVPPERVPRKHQDLLDPWWKGKVCERDPAGTNSPNLVMWRPWRGLEYADWYVDFFYDLSNKATGNLQLIPGSITTFFIRGECGFSLPFYGTDAATIKATYRVSQDAPWILGGSFDIRPQMAEYGLSQTGNAVLTKAPHPNAALLFLNWKFSKEGVEAWARAWGDFEPLRKDVPNLVEEEYRPEPGKGATQFWVDDVQWADFEMLTANTRMIMKLQKEGMSKEAWRQQVKDVSIQHWGQYPPPPSQFYPY